MTVWSLSGTWRVAALDPGPSGPVGPEIDDSRWDEVTVPGHWATRTDLAGQAGPFLFRRHLTVPTPGAGRRRWVEFDGIFYQADIWFDGAYLGDHEGIFSPLAIDVTALSRLGEDHVLAVAVTSPTNARGTPRRAITGVLGDPDGPATRHPGGIWAPVRITETGPIRVEALRVTCRDADPERAHLLVNARLDADTGRLAVVRTIIDGAVAAEHRLTLAGGANEVSWNLDLRTPRLWWPRALGDPELVDIVVVVEVDGAESDRAERRTGLRQVRWDDWVCSVNGERLFLKGANLMPTSDLPGVGEPSGSSADELVRRAAAAGLDVLRVNGHVAPASAYRTADEIGMLLMQDFPLVGVHSRQVRAAAVAQARSMVDLLGHHPSVISWSAHDEPGGPPPPRPVVPAGRVNTVIGRAARLAVQQLPTWNRTILDRWVQRSIEAADPTRRCIPHSGVLPHLPMLDGTDSHLHLGWSDGPVTDLARESARFPRLFRFVSEFGAPGPPDAEAVMSRVIDRWPDIDRDLLTELTGLDAGHLDDQVPPARFVDEAGWRHAMADHQADVARRWIEHLRRLRYRPTGGFCLRAWNDHAATSSWGVYDHRGDARPVLDAVVDACAPVIVVADRLPPSVRPGSRLRLGVHVVSDLRHDIDAAHVTVGIRGPGLESDFAYADGIPPDSCVKVATVEVDVPDRWGDIEVTVTLTAGELRSTWRDRSPIDVPLS